MTEQQRLFIVQARSDFIVFQILTRHQELPACHALHYLQMATEMLGKGHACKFGPNYTTHKAFAGFIRSLTNNRRVQAQAGFVGKNAAWENLIRSFAPLAKQIEDMAPALAQDGPNPEYPWPRANPMIAPAEHSFDLWDELVDSTKGQQFLKLLAHLVSSAEAYL